MCSVQCSVCNVFLCSVQCAVCSVQCAVCSVQCAVCSVQCAVCSVQVTDASLPHLLSLGRLACLAMAKTGLTCQGMAELVLGLQPTLVTCKTGTVP